MLLSEAKKFHATRASGLQLAERATESLIELSIWMEAALKEERHIFDERAPKIRTSARQSEGITLLTCDKRRSWPTRQHPPS